MFQANQQIGGYTLIKQIGRGGFGEVWLAERRTEILTTRVAVKLPHREQINLEAIRQEAQLWAQASGHANVLPIIEANIYDGQIVIVSEYAPDGSLEEKIQQDIPIKQTLETVIGILNGLDFLHARQIIHRDIKPANILLQGETPRLADFGISRVIKTTVHSTSIVGTPKYMAPEAFDGKRTAQTDIWSVGVILYQMLTGKLPYPQENPTELMWAIVSKEIEPIPESIPPDLRKIVHRALAKIPENRFQSAREMREEVQRALLNISHPTFAPTEVLEKQRTDNYTIEDKSIVVNPPLVETPQIILTPTYLVDRTANQNQPQSNIPTEHNSILPTVPSAESQYQEPPPQTVLQLTQLTNQQRQGFHWGFYFLPLLIDLITRLITFNLSYSLARGFGLYSIDFYKGDVQKTYDVELPMEILVYGILGAIFGLIFPQGKWKWGVLLNIGSICVLTLGAPTHLKTPIVNLLTITTISACLASYAASLMSPRKPETTLIEPTEEWTTSRIVLGMFYFVAPIIGILTYLTFGGITEFIYYRVRTGYGWSYEAFLIFDLILIIFFIVLVFGTVGALLGYFFPQQKWRWGMWLNLINIIWIVRLYLIRFENGYFSTETAGLLVLAELIRFLFLFSVPCLTSYLGSRLATRNTEKRL
ncbi:MAG: protein kinase [Pyrinomonadaceae bacterium]|nr:protein kinase [Pyrinomonadaceae bacterium]